MCLSGQPDAGAPGFHAPAGTVESAAATPSSRGAGGRWGGAQASWRPARPVRVFSPCTYLLALCIALCKESPDFWVPDRLLSVGRGQDHTPMLLTFDLAPGPRLAFQPPELWGGSSRLLCSSHGKSLFTFLSASQVASWFLKGNPFGDVCPACRGERCSRLPLSPVGLHFPLQERKGPFQIERCLPCKGQGQIPAQPLSCCGASVSFSVPC